MSGEATPQRTPAQIQAAKENLMPAWQPGQSGNPAGRPKGSRNKLSEDFFKVLAQKFEERGAEAVSKMIDERPHEFAKMIAGLQTKEVSGEGGKALFVGVNVNIRD